MRKNLSPEKKADRALCPVAVAGILRLKVSDVAGAMRKNGITTPLTVQEAKAWEAIQTESPHWLVSLWTEAAIRRARRAEAKRRAEIDHELHMLLLADQVEKRLLKGRSIRGVDAEFIATDMAFRAMKELVRADGDESWLLPIDRAALRYAGVEPSNPDTWFLKAGRGD